MITDWMSAIANTAMAVAAVYAALQAKRRFSNLSYTTAFWPGSQKMHGTKTGLFLQVELPF